MPTDRSDLVCTRTDPHRRHADALDPRDDRYMCRGIDPPGESAASWRDIGRVQGRLIATDAAIQQEVRAGLAEGLMQASASPPPPAPVGRDTPELDLAAIEARANVATEGPWHIWRDLDHQGFWTVGDEAGVIPQGEVMTEDECNPTAHVYVEPDAEFIAHARADVPALVAEVRRLRQERDEQPADVEVLEDGLCRRVWAAALQWAASGGDRGHVEWWPWLWQLADRIESGELSPWEHDAPVDRLHQAAAGPEPAVDAATGNQPDGEQLADRGPGWTTVWLEDDDGPPDGEPLADWERELLLDRQAVTQHAPPWAQRAEAAVAPARAYLAELPEGLDEVAQQVHVDPSVPPDTVLLVGTTEDEHGRRKLTGAKITGLADPEPAGDGPGWDRDIITGVAEYLAGERMPSPVGHNDAAAQVRALLVDFDETERAWQAAEVSADFWESLARGLKVERDTARAEVERLEHAAHEGAQYARRTRDELVAARAELAEVTADRDQWRERVDGQAWEDLTAQREKALRLVAQRDIWLEKMRAQVTLAEDHARESSDRAEHAVAELERVDDQLRKAGMMDPLGWRGVRNLSSSKAELWELASRLATAGQDMLTSGSTSERRALDTLLADARRAGLLPDETEADDE